MLVHFVAAKLRHLDSEDRQAAGLEEIVGERDEVGVSVVIEAWAMSL